MANQCVGVNLTELQTPHTPFSYFPEDVINPTVHRRSALQLEGLCTEAPSATVQQELRTAGAMQELSVCILLTSPRNGLQILAFLAGLGKLIRG